jgi:hypothetical protein
VRGDGGFGGRRRGRSERGNNMAPYILDQLQP